MAKPMKCKTKGVTFNLFDQFQKELFDYSDAKDQFFWIYQRFNNQRYVGRSSATRRTTNESVQVSAK